MVTTFLPYEDFVLSVRVLDNARLGKQRLEANQIIKILEVLDEGNSVGKRGYSNHPATKMWIGYTDALKVYYNTVIEEWIRRGYNNSMETYEDLPKKIKMPWWLGNVDFHKSHQASLVRKNEEFYSKKFPDLEVKYLKLGYVWPISEGVIEFAEITYKADKKLTGEKIKNPLTGRMIAIGGKVYNELVGKGFIKK